MQKTRLGISVGLLGAAIYLMGLFGGYLALVMLVGFSALEAVLGLIPDSLSAIQKIVLLGDGDFQLIFLNNLFSAVIQFTYVVKKILFLILGAKALRQSTVVIPVVDEFISSYM